MVVARPWQLEPILADADARAFEAKAKKPQSRRGFGDFRNLSKRAQTTNYSICVVLLKGERIRFTQVGIQFWTSLTVTRGAMGPARVA